MERNSFKEYSVNTHNVKRRAATDERLFGRFDANREWKQNQTHITSEYYYPQIYISREYSTDMANIGLWLSSREHSKNFGNGTRHVQQ